jgi:hypothetical protein
LKDLSEMAGTVESHASPSEEKSVVPSGGTYFPVCMRVFM